MGPRERPSRTNRKVVLVKRIMYWEVRFTVTEKGRSEYCALNIEAKENVPEITQIRGIMDRVVEMAGDVQYISDFRYRLKKVCLD